MQADVLPVLSDRAALGTLRLYPLDPSVSRFGDGELAGGVDALSNVHPDGCRILSGLALAVECPDMAMALLVYVIDDECPFSLAPRRDPLPLSD